MENTNLKSLLKTGTFGQTDEGLFFVVVGDRLVYESGGFDEIADFNDELISVDDFDGEIFNSVKFIFKDICRCFDCARHIAKFEEQFNILWSREDHEKEKEMKILKSTNTPSMPECKIPKRTFKEEVEEAHQQLKAEAMQRHLGLINTAFEMLKEEPKKQVPTPTLGEVVSLVNSMRKIMIERQNPATDEAIAKMAKTVYKQFGYELPEIEGE